MGTPVVFLHGTRSSSRVWAAQVAVLQRRGVASIALDLPGHGARADERFTLAGAMAVLDDAVARLGEPPLLVGLSLGGYTALHYAGQHPERIAGVMAVACSTQPHRRLVPAFRAAAHHVTRLTGWGGGTWNVVTDVLREVVAVDPISVLRRTTLPVWFVSGSRDPMRVGALRYRRANPRARHSVIRRAGHDANLHQPLAFNARMVRALEELAALARTALAPVGNSPST
ncbi:alpha/beta fold hydrolase [Litorihabitans aurantiacus]|uniref:Lysophospholipase n=1 Tax=Litorihabitans aurantiacus TaxID=1930061 RepID=A0AA37XE76_9MICO|nr:alpha/beta fold hydrolase [Litorihabitans aurantiacus]GMA31543.1 lysophospholipase [Litorihabitans aurantiacus]